MAESCLERYAVHHFSTDVLYRVSGIVRAFDDVDEARGENRTRLSDVMDYLGFKGERGGLLESSCVEDVMTAGDAVHFTVRDNFSKFDICQALADHLNVVFDVDAIYKVDEGPDFGMTSDVQHFEAASMSILRNELHNHIQEVVGLLNEQDGQDLQHIESFASYPLGADRYVEEFSPDYVTLYSNEKGFSSLRLDECSRTELQLIGDYMRRNDELLFGPRYENLRVDVAKERERLLYEVYGSSAAYGAISGYMKGFDVVYVPAAPKELTAEYAKQLAFNAVSLDPQKTFGTVCDYLEHGYEPAMALKKAGVEVPRRMEPERLEFYFAQEKICSFYNAGKPVSPRHADDWRLGHFDAQLSDTFKDFCGIDLNKELVDVDDSRPALISFKSQSISELARKCMLTPENLQEKKSAELVCTRKASQKEFFERYIKHAPESGGKGLKV